VIGLLETHGCRETARQAEGLEQVPRKRFRHRGVELEELDVAAVLQRRPQLVLVDELARSNAPGSERAKRWQDVEALLLPGLDVYSTLNIQHLESLNDRVAELTGVVVRERIPNRVLEQADQVEEDALAPAPALRERVMVCLTTGWRPPSMHPCWCSPCLIHVASSATMRACGWNSANDSSPGAGASPRSCWVRAAPPAWPACCGGPSRNSCSASCGASASTCT